MANTSVDALIDDLACVIVDSTATDNLQNDVLYELARGSMPGVVFQTGAAFTQAIKNTATYSLPAASGARSILTVHYDGQELATARKDEAWNVSEVWRTDPKARPVSYVTDPENRTDYTLIPPPIVSGAAPIGDPAVDEDFVPLNIVVIFMKTDLTLALGPYQDTYLPIAFEVLGRELGRDSNHQDKNASQIAHKLAEFFFQMAFPEMPEPSTKTGSN